MSIGENIKQIRKEKGLTQKELGIRLGGVSQQQIGQWENGDKKPKIETIEKIAAALGVDPFSLYSFEMASDALEKGMNQKENALLDNYRQLNPSGQQKADNYVEDLTKIPEYRKEDDPVTYVNAAHPIDGASEEDKQFDENIMDDEDF